MSTGIPSAVIVTHGGVIMTLLAQYGLPEAGMSDWAMDPGCGYSIRIHPQLWSSAKKVEVYQTIPLPKEEDDYESEYFFVDAPEAKQEQKEEQP